LKAAFLAAALPVLLLGGPGRAEEEERPKIFLEKKIFADVSEGKKSFYEVHTVSEGETLWRILNRRGLLYSTDFATLVKEFRRVNPKVANPGKLVPGQKILVPSGRAPRTSIVAEGKAVVHRIVKGDTLTRILKERGVSRADLPLHLDAVKELNEAIRDVNRIIAGRDILLPTAKYFGSGVGAPPVALTKDVSPEAGHLKAELAKPEAELLPPSGTPPEAPIAKVSPEKAEKKEEGPVALPKLPYRGLLTDLLTGMGEKWVDRGTLYLPVPSGGEVIINLEDFPVVRFSNGIQVLVDFRGTLPQNIRALITETWKNYRVVSLHGAQGSGEMIDRLLKASGYHSVKEGLARPLVIGEIVSVALPARWVVLRTPKSLMSGEVILIKEVPEKPSGHLAAVVRYAGRVGVRVLPYATDPSVFEGYLVNVDDASDSGDAPPRLTIPAGGGLAALYFSLEFLGFPLKKEERLRIGGKGDAFQLVIQPERMFMVGKKWYVVDTGKMNSALRALVKESGYEVFPFEKEETGKGIFQRLLKEAGISTEARREVLLSGGSAEGYVVRVTGTFIAEKGWLAGKKIRGAILVGGRLHSATLALMRDLGVEILEW